MQEKFNIPQKHFYYYLQIRTYLNSVPYHKSGSKCNILHNLIMKAATLNNKMMTYIYNQRLMNDKTAMNIKHSWEQDSGHQLDDQTWHKVLYNAWKKDKLHKTQDYD